MSGAAHQNVAIEPGEVAVSVTALLWAGLMDDGCANQGMAKLNLPQRIHYEKSRVDGGLGVAHHIPGTVRRWAADGDAIQGGPQQVGAHGVVEVSQASAEHRHQTFGQRQGSG